MKPTLDIPSRFSVKADVAFSPDSSVLVACYEGPARLFDLATDQERFRLGGAKAIQGVAFLPDRESVVLAESYYKAGVYSMVDGVRRGKKWVLTKKGHELEAFVHLPQFEKILCAIGYGDLLVLNYNGECVDKISFSHLKPWEVIPMSIAVSPNGQRLAVGWHTVRPRESQVCVSILSWPDLELLHEFSPCQALQQDPDSLDAIIRDMTFLGEETLSVASHQARGFFGVTDGRQRTEIAVRGEFSSLVTLHQSDHFLLSDGGVIECWASSPLCRIGQHQLHPQHALVNQISADDSLIAIASTRGNEILDSAPLLGRLGLR